MVKLCVQTQIKLITDFPTEMYEIQNTGYSSSCLMSQSVTERFDLNFKRFVWHNETFCHLLDEETSFFPVEEIEAIICLALINGANFAFKT